MLGRVVLSAALLLWAAPAAAKGLELSLGVEGGVSRYTGALGGALKAGASWGVHAEARATSWLAVGFAYSGSLNRLSVPGEDAPPLLVRDGFGGRVLTTRPPGCCCTPTRSTSA